MFVLLVLIENKRSFNRCRCTHGSDRWEIKPRLTDSDPPGEKQKLIFRNWFHPTEKKLLLFVTIQRSG